MLVALVALSWSTASAPGSSPDDDFHLASIWCAWGQSDTGCVVLENPEDTQPLTVSVPALATQSATCSAFKPEVSASCAFTNADGSPRDADVTTFPLRANNGAYPAGYYRFMRLFVVDSTATSVVLMRLASATLSIALIVGAALLLGRPDRWQVWHSWLLVSVPLGLFVFASTNPSGVAIAGAAAVLLATVAAVRSASATHRWRSAGLAAVAALIAVNARQDAVYFCGLAVLVALVIALPIRATRGMRTALALLPVAVVLGSAYLLGGSSGLVSGGAQAERQAPTVANLLNVVSFYVGDFSTRLGWLDIPAPSLVWGSMALCLGALLGFGVGSLKWRRAVGFALLLTAAVALPLIMLERTGYKVGEWVQPRYLLPLVLLLFGVLALHSLDGGRPANTRALLWVALLASVAQAISLHLTMRRYITGTDVVSFDLNAGREWWWDVPVPPMIMWWVGTLAFTALAMLLSVRAVAVQEDGPHPHDEHVAVQEVGDDNQT